MNNIKILANHNGMQRIRAKLVEELNECIEAIEGNVENEIIDEIADVLLVSRQLIYKMDIWDQVESRINHKIERTMRREGIV